MGSYKIAELAARIDKLIVSENAVNRTLYTAPDRDKAWELRQQLEALRDERKAAQSELAGIFAERNGWKQASRPFSVGCLAVCGKHGHGGPFYPSAMDHPCFFCKAGRAVAIVGHV